MTKIERYLPQFAWGTLVLNILVILWGAVVRATGSGAGCGAHWPLCNGEVIPQNQQITTSIEFFHRITSGLSIVAVILLFVAVWWGTRQGRLIRRSALFALIFTFSEAIVGAGLVLFHLTGTNDSATRAVVIVIHLVNTFALLASLVLTAWWLRTGEPEKLVWKGKISWLFVGGAACLLFLGGSGAITALGDTLFPSASLAEGLMQDVSPTAHFLIRLRVYHPFVAVTLAIVGYWLLRPVVENEKDPLIKKLISGLMVLFAVQLVLGGINVLLGAPVWMQVVHLLVTELIWLTVVLVLAFHFSRRRALS